MTNTQIGEMQVGARGVHSGDTGVRIVSEIFRGKTVTVAKNNKADN